MTLPLLAFIGVPLAIGALWSIAFNLAAIHRLLERMVAIAERSKQP